MIDKFYPIFDSCLWIEKLIPLGIKFVQLRIKDSTENEIRNEIKKAKFLCHKYNTTLVINDYWKIALEEKCNFVHIGQEDLVDCDIKKLKLNNIKIGISTHDQNELETALLNSPDYIALGPIYPTILKKMKWKQQGLNKLNEWKKQIGNIPLVAIGGMTPERSIKALNSGADMVSVVTDITLNKNPELRVKEWLETIKNYV
ncbi:MAG: thiamine phosphate synthase [Proteobacteria bacterium]|nr:thiamine phosphate synthase [Pseudomonadota bacterium]